MSGVWAVDGNLIAGINSNYGDTATISGTCVKSVSNVCTWWVTFSKLKICKFLPTPKAYYYIQTYSEPEIRYQGNSNGAEPTKLGSGISSYCKYAANGVDDCP